MDGKKKRNIDNYDKEMLRFFVGSVLDAGWMDTSLLDEANILPYADEPDSGLVRVIAKVYLHVAETDNRPLADEEMERLGDLLGEEVDQTSDGTTYITLDEVVSDDIYPEELVDVLVEEHEGLALLRKLKEGGLLSQLR